MSYRVNIHCLDLGSWWSWTFLSDETCEFGSPWSNWRCFWVCSKALDKRSLQ